MDLRRCAIMCTCFFMMISMSACSETGSTEKAPVFRQEPEIMKVKPDRPVKIKLKRSAKGDYAWDVSGSDVDEVLKADKKLKESLKRGD